MVEEQDTIPLPVLLEKQNKLPTVRQIRELCYMTYYEVAVEAIVRPRVVFWMEQGISVPLEEALSILHVFSQRIGRHITIKNVQGIRIKSYVGRK